MSTGSVTFACTEGSGDGVPCLDTEYEGVQARVGSAGMSTGSLALSCREGSGEGVPCLFTEYEGVQGRGEGDACEGTLLVSDVY